MHRLLQQAVKRRFPPVDGRVSVVPDLGGGLECSFAFTGHAVIATRLPETEVLARRPDGFGGSLAPDFLRWLAGPTGWIGVLDVALAGCGVGGGRLPERTDLEDHDRVRHARALRTVVRVFGDERGLVTLSCGLAGRSEISVEVSSDRQGRGHGPSLIREALGLVPAGQPVFAAVSPGNARSLRAFLATGFAPIGSEVIVRPERGGRS